MIAACMLARGLVTDHVTADRDAGRAAAERLVRRVQHAVGIAAVAAGGDHRDLRQPADELHVLGRARMLQLDQVGADLLGRPRGPRERLGSPGARAVARLGDMHLGEHHHAEPFGALADAGQIPQRLRLVVAPHGDVDADGIAADHDARVDAVEQHLGRGVVPQPGGAADPDDEAGAGRDELRVPLGLTPPEDDGVHARGAAHVDELGGVLGALEQPDGHHDVQREDHRVPRLIQQTAHPPRLPSIHRHRGRPPVCVGPSVTSGRTCRRTGAGLPRPPRTPGNSAPVALDEIEAGGVDERDPEDLLLDDDLVDLLVDAHDLAGIRSSGAPRRPAGRTSCDEYQG